MLLKLRPRRMVVFRAEIRDAFNSHSAFTRGRAEAVKNGRGRTHTQNKRSAITVRSGRSPLLRRRVNLA